LAHKRFSNDNWCILNIFLITYIRYFKTIYSKSHIRGFIYYYFLLILRWRCAIIHRRYYQIIDNFFLNPWTPKSQNLKFGTWEVVSGLTIIYENNNNYNIMYNYIKIRNNCNNSKNWFIEYNVFSILFLYVT